MSRLNLTREQYIEKLFENYRLVSVLADKNECKVLRLRHKELNKDLVLRSFPQEVKAYEDLYAVKHKNLPLIYDCINLSDGQIVLEEFINGVTVAQVMESGKYHYFGARRVIKSVCAALDVLHSYGIVHRDIKPENIIIDKDGRVVLIDFNASRKLSASNKDTVIMGTVGYASPEQLGVLQSDARTDIYATGILLNVMITGKHPSESLARGRIGYIVRKCTAVNPDERYQTAQKLSDALWI